MSNPAKNAEMVYRRAQRLVDEFDQAIDNITITETVDLLRVINQLKAKLDNEMWSMVTNHLL